MKGFILCVILQLSWSYAYPGNQKGVNGVGAYAYQDSSGNRYGGTYDLGPDSLGPENNFIGPFGNDFQDFDSFFPIYFGNFEKLLQEIFGSDITNQRLASFAAQRAYDLTYRMPNSFFRFPPFGGFPNSIDNAKPFGMPNFGPNFAQNSAFASSVAGPGRIHQMAAINPANPAVPNVDVTRQGVPQGRSNYYGVSSSSYASSSNINGKTTGTRRAETVVNDNGVITKYKVEN